MGRRLRTPHRCNHCGRPFFPNPHTRRLYCSMDCVWASTIEKAKVAREARTALQAQPLSKVEREVLGL